MAYTTRNFVEPDFSNQHFMAPQQTTDIADTTGMGSFLPLLSASTPARPVKNRQVQITTPYAQQDMVATRNRIGQASQALSNALKTQETPLYATLKALGSIEGSSEPGGWLEAAFKGLSSGGTALTDIKINNARQNYINQMKDLAQILAFDKEMGQTVETDLGYMYPETTNNNNEMLALALLLGGK